MKIGLLGTHVFKNAMEFHKNALEKEGHEVRLPAFDDYPEFDEHDIMSYNRALVEWSDEIHCFWDQRSIGFVFDMGMCFMARKEIKFIVFQTKTIAKGFLLWEKEGPERKKN